MKIEALCREGRYGFGDLGSVRVNGFGRDALSLLLLIGAQRGERRFDSEATLTAATFCGGVFWSGE